MRLAQFFAHSSLVACTSLLLVNFAAPASAITFDLNEISASNIGTGSQGLVTLTPDALDPTHKIDVVVSLSDGVLMVNSGGPHTPFVFSDHNVCGRCREGGGLVLVSALAKKP